MRVGSVPAGARRARLPGREHRLGREDRRRVLPLPDLLSRADIAAAAGGIIERCIRTGRLTTDPGGTRTVGYDFGLLLFTLTELGHPLAERVYRHMLDVRDATGAWVEYYDDDRPVGCPCRPYESGINLEAALRFATRWTAHGDARAGIR